MAEESRYLMEADGGGPSMMDPFVVGADRIRGVGLLDVIGSSAFGAPSLGSTLGVGPNSLTSLTGGANYGTGGPNIRIGGREVIGRSDIEGSNTTMVRDPFTGEVTPLPSGVIDLGTTPTGLTQGSADISDRIQQAIATREKALGRPLTPNEAKVYAGEIFDILTTPNRNIDLGPTRSTPGQGGISVIPLPVSPGVAAGLTIAGAVLGGGLGGSGGLPGTGSASGAGATGTGSATGGGAVGTGTSTTSSTEANPKPEQEPPENSEWELHNGIWIPVPKTPPPGNVPPGQKWDKRDGNWVLVPSGTNGPPGTNPDDDWMNRGPGMVIWPGQPRNTACPIGQTRNPTTGQCEPTVQACPAGQQRNATTGQCEPIPDEQCPAGQTRNPTTGQCEVIRTECPVGQERGPDGQCRAIVVLPPNPTPGPTTTQPPSGGNISLTFPVATPITVRDPGLNRDLLREGRISAPALKETAGSTVSSYGTLGGQPGEYDIEAFQNLIGNIAAYTPELTRIATEQTISSNRALRDANISDVQRLGQAAMEAQRAANPELYSTLGTYLPAATGMLATDLERLQGAGRLSADEVRTAQQAAREGSAARGRDMDMSGIAAEVLNRDAYSRQRQAEARANVQQSMQNVYGGIGAAQAATFNPFAALLGQQYGMQTSNVGQNQALFGQGSAFSSGGLSNQFVQGLLNPYSSYANDVYGSNFNAANARVIQEAMANAAAQGANQQLLGGLAGLTLNYALPEFMKIFTPKG